MTAPARHRLAHRIQSRTVSRWAWAVAALVPLVAVPAAAVDCDIQGLGVAPSVPVYGHPERQHQPAPIEYELPTERTLVASPVAERLLLPASTLALVRHEQETTDDGEGGTEIPEQRSFRRTLRLYVCDLGQIVPFLDGKDLVTEVEWDLRVVDGYLRRFDGRREATYLSWNGTALVESRKPPVPPRPLTRVDGIYVIWACDAAVPLSIGERVSVRRGQMPIGNGRVTGSYRGTCEAELDASTIKDGPMRGDMVDIVR
jgi:hypothetical protein